MRFATPLTRATLVRRYKRFLADVRLQDGSLLTIHCPNSGSMRSCSEPGSEVCFSDSANPKRNYPHTLEMVRVGSAWVGVNTGLANALTVEALTAGTITELPAFDRLAREVSTGTGSRLDIVVEQGGKKTYIEVKNCSLAEDGCALFPDAVTARGTKHLQELERLAGLGHGAVIFYLVQRRDADRFAPAAAIDPLYARTLVKAWNGGVRILVYQAEVTPERIEVVRPLPVHLPCA